RPRRRGDRIARQPSARQQRWSLRREKAAIAFPHQCDQITTSRSKSFASKRCLRISAIWPEPPGRERKFILVRGCEMIGKLAEPNLTKRLDCSASPNWYFVPTSQR